MPLLTNCISETNRLGSFWEIIAGTLRIIRNAKDKLGRQIRLYGRWYSEYWPPSSFFTEAAVSHTAKTANEVRFQLSARQPAIMEDFRGNIPPLAIAVTRRKRSTLNSPCMILHGFSASGVFSSIVIRVILSGVVVEEEKVNLQLISYL